jgi:hypothetical protein
MGIAKAALDGIWKDIGTVCKGELNTPAEQSTFTVAEVQQDRIVITLNSGNPMNVGREAFEGALRYLLEHGHHHGAQCQIRSAQRYEDAGPLCQAARTDKGTRASTYVLPILKQMGLVGIDPDASPVSTAWYIA